MSSESQLLTEIPQELHDTKGRLFRCCLPLSASLDPHGTVLEQLKSVAESRSLLMVSAPPYDEILRLTDGKVPDIAQLYLDAGFHFLHAPWVEKYSLENHGLLDDLVAQVVAHLNDGGAVAVHCHSGFGRGGVILAAVLGKLKPGDSSETVSRLQSVNAQFLAQPKSKGWTISHLDRLNSNL